MKHTIVVSSEVLNELVTLVSNANNKIVSEGPSESLFILQGRWIDVLEDEQEREHHHRK